MVFSSFQRLLSKIKWVLPTAMPNKGMEQSILTAYEILEVPARKMYFVMIFTERGQKQ